MLHKKFDSRALRQLAQELLDNMAGDNPLPEDERRDLITSLVRQWLTYDGNATLFLGGRQFHFPLAEPAPDTYEAEPRPVVPNLLDHLRRHRAIDPDRLSAAIDQLNRGQSAEVIDGAGVRISLHVNPRERSQGALPLNEPADPRERRYRNIGRDLVKEHFGPMAREDETEALAGSLAKQWAAFDGHASLFLDSRRELHFRLVEHGNGTSTVQCRPKDIDLYGFLASLGFGPDEVPGVIYQLNQGHKVEFTDRHGHPSSLWHNPQRRRMRVDSFRPKPDGLGDIFPPVCCAKCGAVLSPWQDGKLEQACPLCGQPTRLT